MSDRRRSRLWILAATICLVGCARNRMVLELHGTVMYEKPQIREISHTLEDSRLDGGTIYVKVTFLGDPGLSASFDISPGIAERQPMKETDEGRYVGEFSFHHDIFGGPYSITGRLRHDKAGEVILRDPNPITIPLLGR